MVFVCVMQQVASDVNLVDIKSYSITLYIYPSYRLNGTGIKSTIDSIHRFFSINR